MFYVSKISPFFFIVAYIDLFFSMFYKGVGDIQNLGLILVYGFIINVILGGLYQIVPNSQSLKLKFPEFSYGVFLLSFFADLIFVFGNSLKFFAILKLFTVFLFLGHISHSIKIIKPLTIRFIITGLFYLIFSILSLNLYLFFGLASYQFSIHSLTVGVMSNLIIGVLFTWIPMLTMQVLNLKMADRFYYIYQITVIVLLASFLIGNYDFIIFTGFFLLLTVLFFLYIIYDSVFKNKKAIVLPVVVKYFLLGYLFFICGVISILLTLSLEKFDLLIIHIDFMVYGFGFLILSGAIMHLLPRIIWNWFYQEKVKSGKDVPPIHKLINENFVLKFLYLYLPFLFLNIFLDYLGFLNISASLMVIFYFVFLFFSFNKILKFILN